MGVDLQREWPEFLSFFRRRCEDWQILTRRQQGGQQKIITRIRLWYELGLDPRVVLTVATDPATYHRERSDGRTLPRWNWSYVYPAPYEPRSNWPLVHVDGTREEIVVPDGYILRSPMDVALSRGLLGLLRQAWNRNVFRNLRVTDDVQLQIASDNGVHHLVRADA